MLGLERLRETFKFDRRHIEEKGVVLPVKRMPIRFLPGRHLLGRAGDGMRFLRSRPYDPLEDNPRHIDRFSSPDEPEVNEWEHETQADVLVLADVSASMAYPAKAQLRDAVVLQLIYSLWRAGDRVKVGLFADRVISEIHEQNLRAAMDEYKRTIKTLSFYPQTDISHVLEKYHTHYVNGRVSLILVVSDFITPHASDARQVIPVNLLRHMKGDLISIVITFKLGEEAEGVGKVWDPERNREGIVMLSRARRSRINNAERTRVDQVCRMMRDTNVDAISVSERKQVYPKLQLLARTRESRRL